jgi:arsenite-transporting ATPase
MGPRTILVTGKGGVGKTSVAACTAMRCAAAGMRTLVISTDPAHSLADSFKAELGAAATPVADNLWGQQVIAQQEMERHWSGVQDWLGEILIEHGVDRISAEELTVPPGMDELFSLLCLQHQHRSGSWDAIVVDCAPTGETLRLLSFPDVARWWIDKVFPVERQLLAAARPIARSLLDISLPGAAVLSDIRRLSAHLVEMNEILRDRQRCTIRLVMTPDRMVIGEAMRTFTYLNLYGFLTDAVVVNRVFPSAVGEYFAGWRRLQEEHLTLVRSAFAPVPVLCAPYFDQEVLGAQMLERLAGEIYGEAHDAAALLHDSITQELIVEEDGARLRLALPLAAKPDVTLKKVGMELIVGVGEYRRTIVLPAALAALKPTGARFEDGALEVVFADAR